MLKYLRGILKLVWDDASITPVKFPKLKTLTVCIKKFPFLSLQLLQVQ